MPILKVNKVHVSIFTYIRKFLKGPSDSEETFLSQQYCSEIQVTHITIDVYNTSNMVLLFMPLFTQV